MSVGGAIMAHPVRGEWVEELVSQTGYPISWSVGEPTVDPEKRWAVGRAAWELAAQQGAEWSLVVQDDAVLCNNFLTLIESLTDAVGDKGLVCAYTGTPKIKNGIVQSSSLQMIRKANGPVNVTSMGSLNWGVAIAVPTKHVLEMLSWCDAREGDPYDYRIGCYLRDELGLPTWHPHPSLVDHRGKDSLIGRDSDRPRVAYWFDRNLREDTVWRLSAR